MGTVDINIKRNVLIVCVAEVLLIRMRFETPLSYQAG